MKLDSAEVVIIGAGVTGLSAAWWLAKNGVDTVVVEKGVIGAEASSRNGGDISHRAYEPPVVPLAAESLRLWPEMDDDLGYPTEYSPGSLSVAMNEENVERMKRTKSEWEEEFDLPLQWWDADTVKDAVPMIAEDARGAMFSPTAGHANPQRTVQAYAWGFLDQGGRLYQHTAVTRLPQGRRKGCGRGDGQGRGRGGHGDLRCRPSDRRSLRAGGGFRTCVSGPRRDHHHRARGVDVEGRRARKRALRPPDAQGQPRLRRRDPTSGWTSRTARR